MVNKGKPHHSFVYTLYNVYIHLDWITPITFDKEYKL
jgi:hypothetical protein